MQYRIADATNNYPILMHVAIEMAKAEELPDNKSVAKLKWIKENTTEMMRTNFFSIAKVVMIRYPLYMSFEMKNNKKRIKEWDYDVLCEEMEKAHEEINEIANNIAKKYSIEIPFQKFGESYIPNIPQEMLK